MTTLDGLGLIARSQVEEWPKTDVMLNWFMFAVDQLKDQWSVTGAMQS